MDQEAIVSSTSHIKVVLLINFIPPYHLPTLRLMNEAFGRFRVLVSTTMEKNRDWSSDWGGLDVKKQKSLTLTRKWDHPQGFTDKLYVHIPYATFFELYRERPNVIISTEMGVRSLLAFTYRFFFRTVRLILWLPLSEHSEKGRGWIRTLMRWIFIRHADAVFVNGESGARYIRKFGVPESRIFRVPYPTDDEKIQLSDVIRDQEHAYRLIFVGQLIGRKGILQFLKTLTKWANDHPDRKLDFVIVGSGDLYSKIDQFSVPANLDISLLGHQDYDQLQEIYQNAGIFVFPTLADEWGIVVNEALRAGLPVLGSIYSQAVEELIEEGKTGWHFVPDDPGDIYRAIDQVMNTPIEVLSRMRVDGQTRSLECSPSQIVKTMIDALQFVAR